MARKKGKRKSTAKHKKSVALRNLAKARRARWRGHKKARKGKKKTKAQRRAIALRNLRKAHRANRGKRRTSGGGRRRRRRSRRSRARPS